MSVQTAQQFVEALDRETSLSTQFYVTSPNSLDGVVDFASVRGYVFTKDELEKALKHAPQSSVSQQLRQFVR